MLLTKEFLSFLGHLKCPFVDLEKGGLQLGKPVDQIGLNGVSESCVFGDGSHQEEIRSKNGQKSNILVLEKFQQKPFGCQEQVIDDQASIVPERNEEIFTLYLLQ